MWRQGKGPSGQSYTGQTREATFWNLLNRSWVHARLCFKEQASTGAAVHTTSLFAGCRPWVFHRILHSLLALQITGTDMSSTDSEVSRGSARAEIGKMIVVPSRDPVEPILFQPNPPRACPGDLPGARGRSR